MNTETCPIDLARGQLGQARRVCAFFNSRDEEYRTLTPFIKEGIDQGQKAFHIVDKKLKADHLSRLKQAGIDTEAAMANGQFEARPWEEAYLRGDRFDQDAMLALVEQVIQEGACYPLSRLIGHMEWATFSKHGVEDLAEYETRLNSMLPKYDAPSICAYDLSKFGTGVAFDILRTHPMVIVGGTLQMNPFYVPPDEFLSELRGRRTGRKAVALA